MSEGGLMSERSAQPCHVLGITHEYRFQNDQDPLQCNFWLWLSQLLAGRLICSWISVLVEFQHCLL
jgi:hypothetical protein